jgi:tRNA(Ile)-lysidine synthase TilS/MesJ
LHANNIEYLTDHTNLSDAYLRNRIRKHILPAAQKCDDRFDQKFQSTLKHLQEEEDFLQKLAKQEFYKIFKTEQKEIQFFVGQLNEFKKLDTVLQKRILVLWFIKEKVSFNLSENYLNEVLRFLNSQRGGTHKLNQKWELFKKKNQFWITKS